MEQRRIIYFPENDCRVVTGLCANGEYGAYREDEGRIRGYGHTRLAAIADLARLIGEMAEWEEHDHRAARFDRNQDERKNWVAS